MGTIDLHTHSTVSDGLLTPNQLLAECAERGLTAMSLTDHETVGGLLEAETAAHAHGIDFLPGVELNTNDGPHEVHVLGYDVDRTNQAFLDGLAALEDQRVERIERMIDRLTEIGSPVDRERVFTLSGPGTIGRPHVARALIERGYVGSVNEAFDRYLASGRPGFVPRRKNLPENAVRLVLQGGGAPALAHPLTAGDIERMLERLVPAGLAGLEVYYGEYDDDTRQQLLAIARRWNLIPTGGSDYHGEGFRHGRVLGGQDVPPETVELLRDAARRGRDASPVPMRSAVDP